MTTKNLHVRRRFTRREFVKAGAQLGTGLVLFPHLLPRSAEAGWLDSFSIGGLGGSGTSTPGDADPHFLLLIVPKYVSGMDCSYLFDARPPEMTQNGVIQNYRQNKDSTPWQGANGLSTLATEIVQPLEPFRDRFSVINGVLMAPNFDGHDQNFNYLFTGNAFGGECFLPHLNGAGSAASRFPLDSLQKGRIHASITNGGGLVPLDVDPARNLVASLAKVPPLAPSSSLFGFLRSRLQGNGPVGSGGQSGGMFSAGSQAMASALDQAPALSAMFSQVQVPATNTDADFVRMAGQFFKTGAAKSAILVPDLGPEDFDTHDVGKASAQPKAFAAWVASLASCFAALRDTPFDGSRSLFDVTTVLVSAEFSRTMRQQGKPMDATGTDHNPWSNSVLIGGKGIAGGLVVGASDYASSTETLSPAHLSIDHNRLIAVGRPYDFARDIPRTDLPQELKLGDYLGFGSVINTIYDRFGVPSAKWRTIERNGATAPVIQALRA